MKNMQLSTIREKRKVGILTKTYKSPEVPTANNARNYHLSTEKSEVLEEKVASDEASTEEKGGYVPGQKFYRDVSCLQTLQL